MQGNKVRRNKSLTEINHYDPENDEINVQDVYQWQAETDEFLKMGESNTLDEIQFDRGWTRERLDREMRSRQIVLAYPIENDLNTYTQVAATLQAFINDPESILGLIATDELERSLEDLREMESVEIDIDPEKEAMVPRPSASEEMLEVTGTILEDAEEMLDEYRDEPVEKDITDALKIDEADDIEPDDPDEPDETDEEGFDYGGFSFEAEDGPEGGEATTDGGEASGASRASSDGQSDGGESAVDEFGLDGEES